MLHEYLQTISMRSNIREWTYVLLVNTSRSHLHSFCATGVSSGLSTRMTLTRALRGGWKSLFILGWTWFWFNFYTVVCDCLFMCSLFNNAFCVTQDCILSNEDKRWTVKNVEGSGRRLILRHFPGICQEGLRKPTKNICDVSSSHGGECEN
jgi:hypothetical protein